MTLTVPQADELDDLPAPGPVDVGGQAAGHRAPASHRTAAMWWVAVWVLAVLGAMGMVIYGLGPLFQSRDQRRLLTEYRQAVDQAANESSGLGGVTVPTHAPDLGEPVGILEIGAIRLQQAVVEGAYASQTRRGPGHVAGTAGLGQPGNAVVVGRAHAFDGPFNQLGRLRRGNSIVVTTTQGQSLYRVNTVRHRGVSDIEGTYGPGAGNQLTLITSDSVWPLNRSGAVVVVATLQGLPFPTTPQNGRVSSGLGPDGDGDADASVVLTLVLFGATISASIALYRRVRPATAYLLTIGPLLATAVIAGETLVRLFPAWS